MRGQRWRTALTSASALLLLAGPPAVGAGRRTPPPALPLLHAVPDAADGGRIVDAAGRQVVLRGVNVNSLGEYARNNAFPPTAPFRAGDPAVIRGIGWNVVRLVVSWSAVEPTPGRYDAGYLRRVAATVKSLADAGVYTIVDMHQDAWSATLATRPGEACPPPSRPTLGFDGAPAWATLGSGLPHCEIVQREGSPAVYASWQAFLADAPGPGGVGVGTRFVRMWGYVAAYLARSTAVAGFDLLNEPLLLGPGDAARAARLYARTLSAIRAGERSRRGVRHLVMVEPSILFSNSGEDAPVPFPHDPDVAFAPHIYTGTFPSPGPPDPRWFSSARRLAGAYGGVPVVNGEWGGRPRSRDPIDAGYFNAYQALQDSYGFSGVYWIYRSSCGDPFEIDQKATEAGGLYDVDCRTNRDRGIRRDLARLLARPYPRAVTGRISSFSFDPRTRLFRLAYTPSRPRRALTEVALPRRAYPAGYRVAVRGAAVVSPAGASVLRLREDRRASTVEVTVAPAVSAAR